MKKTLRISHVNRILRIVILLLLLLLAAYAIKCRIDTGKMKAELNQVNSQIAAQSEENQEVANYLENSDYYLEQKARGENDYSDPEEKVFVVVP